MAAKTRKPREDTAKWYWARFTLTNRLLGIAPYNRFYGLRDRRNYSINKVGALAERILRGEVPNPFKPRRRAA